MKKSLLNLLNPVQWIKAYQFHQANAKFDKSTYDLELYLYSKVLKSDMLHYGYFENIDIAAEDISLKAIEDAQIKYAQNIIDLIKNKDGLILDVGCGMGGLSGMLAADNLKVEALTPNINQKNHIDQKYKGVKCYHTKFEDFQSTNKYETIINSESLQYIDLDTAIAHVDHLLTANGQWIIVDYFRHDTSGIEKSGQILETFKEKIAAKGWKISYFQDITLNALPTIKWINMYAERFLIPLKHFAFEKLRYKKGWLYFLTNDLRNGIDKKMQKEFAAINPEKFLKEKKYLTFVIEKN